MGEMKRAIARERVAWAEDMQEQARMKSTLVIAAAIIAAAITPILFPITSPPGGVGGAWRDDHPDNIQAVHWWTVLPERCPAQIRFWTAFRVRDV